MIVECANSGEIEIETNKKKKGKRRKKGSFGVAVIFWRKLKQRRVVFGNGWSSFNRGLVLEGWWWKLEKNIVIGGVIVTTFVELMEVGVHSDDVVDGEGKIESRKRLKKVMYQV